MKRFSTRRRIAAAAVVIICILFVARPGGSRLKSRIINSISRAVGRPADIGSVHLRFLPQPGFDLENLVIYEDSAFGAEPMLRAPEVTAVVRLSSLMRGRLDISRLELTEPSLNLVQREDGRWNWESLLERTARTPLAPTAKSKSEARTGFPYIEASSGRINFKAGAEKKPYALLNADFSLWQESENAWGVRLKAEPLRTDMSLSDTGLLRMNGTWQRAGNLRETPLQFSVEWDRAQLGQLTKLASGNDKGWRGDVRFETTLHGTPGSMQIVADTSIQNFHRYDISTTEGLGLAAHCQGKYNSAEGMMREIFCSGPVGSGVILLRGDAGRPGLHLLNLSLNVENVPVSSLAQLARRAKKDLPADIAAEGNVRGNFTVKETASAKGPAFDGRGEITNLQLESASTKAEFAPESFPFSLGSGRDSNDGSPRRKFNRQSAGLPSSDELCIQFGPFALALGRAAPAQVRGWLGLSGYQIAVRGDGEISHALRMANLFGLPATKASVEGTATMDLQIDGLWTGNDTGTASGFIAPKLTGVAELHNVRAVVRGVNEPLEVAAAEMKLLPDETRVEKLSARAAKAVWTGSVALPRGCGTAGACVVHFNLNADEIAFGDLIATLRPPANPRRWYQVLAPAETPVEPGAQSFLKNLRASGTINAGKVRIHGVVANRVSAAVDLDRGKLTLANLSADALGGKHRGDWKVDFTGVSPVYAGAGTLSGISLEQMADTMHDAWISGTADGNYQVKAVGADAAAFWQSAEGELRFDLRDGILSHVSLDGSERLRVGRWQGSARLRSGKIEIAKEKIDSPEGVFELSGTASLGRVLDLKLAAANAGGAGSMVYSITGTLAEPQVALAPAPETQAQGLKPLPKGTDLSQR